MSSALKQPVLPTTATSNTSSGTNTNIANSPLAINKNIQQSATLSSLGSSQVANKNLSQPTNMQVGNAAPLGVNRNFQQSGSNLQHNIPSAQAYNSQMASHTNPNSTSAHQQPVPNMAHQQTVQSMQQAVTAHQVHPQVAPDMQAASMQFNKPVNCSSSTSASGVMPSPVNMVQERASNQNQAVPSICSQTATTTTQNTTASLSTATSNMSTATVTTSSQPSSMPLSSSSSSSTSTSQKTNTGNSTENTSSTTVPAPSLVKSTQSNGTVDTSIKPSVENPKDEQTSPVDSQTPSEQVTSAEKTDSDAGSVEKKDDNNTTNKEDNSPKSNKKETTPTSSTNVETLQKPQNSTISSSNVSSTQSSNVTTNIQVQNTTETTSTSTVQSHTTQLSSSNSTTTTTVSNQASVQNSTANTVKTTPPKTDSTTPQKTTPSRTAITLKVGTLRTASKRKSDIVNKSPKSNESNVKMAKVDGATTPRNHNKTSSRTDDQKSGKRVRVRTQPYQSPLPEMALISKLSSTPKRSNSANDDKLIAFYKNEFLAVRNTEGWFYVCQTVQNVYKTSSKIRIRWLSNQDKTTDIYTPDFYDFTEFDCILTNLSLEKLEKGKFRLPKDELERTESILKRALDVEKGLAEASDSLTEEHPDGLDLSLLRDENQLKKRKSKSNSAKSRKRKSPDAKTEKPTVAPKVAKISVTKRSPKRASRTSTSKTTASAKSATPKKVTTPSSSNTRAKKVVVKKVTPKVASAKKTKPKASPSPKKAASTPSTANSKKETPAAAARSQRYASRRGDTKISIQKSPVVDANKAKVLAKVAGRKTSSSTVSKTPAPSKTNEKKAVAARGTKSVPASSSSGRGTRSSTNVPQTPTSSRRQTKRVGKK